MQNPTSSLKDNYVYASWRDVNAQEFQQRWPNFSPQELACKGTGQVLLNFRALDMLQRLRNELGRPLIITSAYRSPEHNAAVGGASRSNHMQGIAFDVVMANQNPEAFERAAVKAGFRGIGHYPASNFMHIDARRTDNVVRFKGNGRNNRWFFEGLPSAGSTSNTTPDFTVAPPARPIDTVRELAPVLGPAVVGPMVALGNGDGPVQWALGAAVLVAVIAGAFFLLKKYRKNGESENA